ncbi:single-stranded DNA-binding protein [Buttiauxella sp. A2-C2_NF]|uniref:single-stranded DNA-binding protein n=1 Tax=Buttiauxella ferragutiae TaxID=82989 RepID=UPI001E2D0EAF|nr:single-stranded DNA-binding protein [Buttiauxella ferragutiae]MCE0825544.1 single-stranded DNA-binding protein [Buttiauxella ferragutiae]
MTAQISAYGRLVADPQTRTTASDKQMTMARLAVSLPCHTGPNGEATYWLGVVAFGKQAELLAKHQKGDLISVAGNMQLNQWAGQDGVQKEQPQVIADSVISARTVRSGGKTGSQAQAQATSDLNHAQQQNNGNEYDQTPPFNDEVSF